jgi:hypothetical protein
MFKKVIAVTLAGLMINVAGVRFAYADEKEENQIRFVEKVKVSVQKLGTGEAARVKVQLRDKTMLEGYISTADDEGFTVTNSKTGMAIEVAYPQVKSVKGNNLSTGAKIAIGVGIAIVALVLIFKDHIIAY